MAADAEHHADMRSEYSKQLIAAILSMEASPDHVHWLYIRMVLHYNLGNISTTARALGMHRRTLQRILSKNAPSINGRNTT